MIATGTITSLYLTGKYAYVYLDGIPSPVRPGRQLAVPLNDAAVGQQVEVVLDEEGFITLMHARVATTAGWRNRPSFDPGGPLDRG